jgi:hypothetical protein
MERITTLDQVVQYAQECRSLHVVVFDKRQSFRRPAAWFLSLQARTLYIYMKNGLFLYERATPHPRVKLISHETRTGLKWGSERDGFQIGHEYDAPKKQDDYVLIIGHGKRTWVGLDQVEFLNREFKPLPFVKKKK